MERPFPKITSNDQGHLRTNSMLIKVDQGWPRLTKVDQDRRDLPQRLTGFTAKLPIWLIKNLVDIRLSIIPENNTVLTVFNLQTDLYFHPHHFFLNNFRNRTTKMKWSLVKLKILYGSSLRLT